MVKYCLYFCDFILDIQVVIFKKINDRVENKCKTKQFAFIQISFSRNRSVPITSKLPHLRNQLSLICGEITHGINFYI